MTPNKEQLETIARRAYERTKNKPNKELTVYFDKVKENMEYIVYRYFGNIKYWWNFKLSI